MVNILWFWNYTLRKFVTDYLFSNEEKLNRNHRNVKKQISYSKLAFLIGISDYIKAQRDYYYIDKILLTKGFWDEKFPGIKMELKYRKVEKFAKEAMGRIDFKRYVTELLNSFVLWVIKYGIVFL